MKSLPSSPVHFSAGRTLLSLFLHRVEAHGDRVATQHVHGKKVVSTSWGDWARRSRTLASAFLDLGLEPGDRIAILATTRVEWAWIDIAVIMGRCISVPLFPTETADGCSWALNDSGARLIIVEDPIQALKVLSKKEQNPHLEWVVVLDKEAKSPSGEIVTLPDSASTETARPQVLRFDNLRRRGEQALVDQADRLDERIRAHSADDVICIHYTPGTEGHPKGVTLTQSSYASTARAVARALPLASDDVHLLYLPLAQPFARLCLAVSFEASFVTAFGGGYRTVMRDCERFRPTFLAGVPRLFEKVQGTLERERRRAPALERFVVNFALSESDEGASESPGLWRGLKRALTSQFVTSRLREFLGGRIRFLISGGGALRVDTGRFFRAHDIEILEGYGMTETNAATHLNQLQDNRLGTVGRALPGIETRLTDSGEILIRGAHVTPGFWKNPGATRVAIDEDGWLHTGDLGQFDEDGFLRITGRKRNVIITANGKAIAPQPIEGALRSDAIVSQVLIHGEGRNFLTALFSLSRQTLLDFAADNGVQGDYAACTRSPIVYSRIEALVERVNATLPSHEHIRKFAILPAEPSLEAGELTQTHVLRRAVAADRHRALLDSFHSDSY